MANALIRFERKEDDFAFLNVLTNCKVIGAEQGAGRARGRGRVGKGGETGEE